MGIGCFVSGLVVLSVLAGYPTGAAEETKGEAKAAYTVTTAKVPPVIDGKLDDAVWQEAAFSDMYDFVSLAEQKKTKANPATTFALVADERTLYVAFRCQEPNIDKMKKSVTERD